jgi:cytochrome P460
MRKLLAIFGAILIALFAVFLQRANSSPSNSPGAISTAFISGVDPDLAKLSKYRGWTLVNPTPVQMDQRTAAMCAAAVPQISTTQNPHFDKYISVYVNEQGREPMMMKRVPSFPVGSMIVKEKLSDKSSKEPELLTAMIKRSAGFYPEGGDWEYLVLDGSASKIVERGKLDQCKACHLLYKHADFVTRLYLPDAVANELK